MASPFIKIILLLYHRASQFQVLKRLNIQEKIALFLSEYYIFSEAGRAKNFIRRALKVDN
jgi:hypothetical protein